MTILNLCRGCDTDFASVAAFDRHRTGTHDYPYSEGLQMTPTREDGRRCMAPEEMLEHGMEVDPRSRWRVVLSEASQRRRRESSGLRRRAENGARVALTTMRSG